ncbi:hypothetical protein Tco_0556206 [Tanacetum coccineum]
MDVEGTVRDGTVRLKPVSPRLFCSGLKAYPLRSRIISNDKSLLKQSLVGVVSEKYELPLSVGLDFRARLDGDRMYSGHLEAKTTDVMASTVFIIRDAIMKENIQDNIGWVVCSDIVMESCDVVLIFVVTASRYICDAVSSHCREILDQCLCRSVVLSVSSPNEPKSRKGEDDAFVVINLSGKVVKYNLISKTNTEIFDIGSNQMDDDDDAVLFIPPFEVDPNLYEFIPSLASV